MAFTTLSSWALLVWEELHQRGIEADVLFRQAGLDPAHLRDPNARFPVEGLRRMWATARELTDDPALGVAVGMRWNPTTFHALGYAWLASSTLAEGFHRLARYGRLISDQYQGELTLSGMEYRYRGTPRLQAVDPDPTAVEAITVAIVKMCRLLAGEGFSPLEIVLPIAPGASVLHLETNLRSPLKFGDRALELVLSRADMQRPLRSANPELSRLNEQIVVKHLSRLEKDSVGLQVQSLIAEALPSGRVTEDDIAQTLNLSNRTLQRRLAEEGRSFGDILQNTRRELADSYLRDSQLSINEIAYLLGFSEQANFTRACKRWFGQAPSEYRRQLAAAV